VPGAGPGGRVAHRLVLVARLPASCSVQRSIDTDVTTQVWYCGGAPGPKTTVNPDHVHDSNIGKNFLFTL
jgi:hypothetical protein